MLKKENEAMCPTAAGAQAGCLGGWMLLMLLGALTKIG